ncbi:unnamed protein product [Menidia menidia]|uniref:Cilia- and flagella-associated protein 263 n=1 Tax=Menidia menidia TaxID=238744 RepID=A0A8S4BHR4_9TELE|nr:unnamed protein product [Menidia menidia]
MEDDTSCGEKDKTTTDEEKELLYNRVKELKCSNAILLAETDMFEQFIARLEQLDMDTRTGGEAPQVAGESQLDGGDAGWRQKSRSKKLDDPQLLSLEQKLYVAKREIKETRKNREKFKQKYEKIEDHYKASIKHAELRLAEINKAKTKFERRFLRPMGDRLEGNQPEKVLRYLEDKQKLTQLEKFHLKNQALKIQEKKLLQQLQQKKELEKADYEVFFQEYSEPIMDRNLDELQINCLKAQQNLNAHKEKLHSVTLESTELSNNITKKLQMLDKIEEDIQHAERERSKAEALNRHLHKQLTDYRAPEIIEYVHAKDKHRKLKQSVRIWERKVGIAEMALKTHTGERGKYRATQTPTNSAEPGTRSGEHQIPVKLPHIAEHNT